MSVPAPLEAETLQVRVLPRAWRWALAVSAAATILLCINQQFALRFLVGFTPLNTEYYYALVLVALPFVFPVFPGGPRAPLDRALRIDSDPAGRLVRRVVGADLVEPRPARPVRSGRRGKQ